MPFTTSTLAIYSLTFCLCQAGIKVWSLADSVTGYMSGFAVYAGKEAGSNGAGLGTRVVTNLTKPLNHKNHLCFCDNFFTSVELFDQLEVNRMYAAGTCRNNRKHFPLDIRSPKLEKGQSLFRQDNKLVATVWQDNKPAYFLSTFCSPTDMTIVSRRQKDGTLKEFPAPRVVVE